MDVSGNGKMVGRRSLVNVGELGDFLDDTIERVANTDERTVQIEKDIKVLSEVKILLTNVATAQTVMAHSAQSMADTFKKSEERQERLEARYERVVQTASGKKQVPMYLLVLVLVFFSVYVLVDKMKASNLNLDIPWLGIHITQEPRGRDV